MIYTMFVYWLIAGVIICGDYADYLACVHGRKMDFLDYLVMMACGWIFLPYKCVFMALDWLIEL